MVTTVIVVPLYGKSAVTPEEETLVKSTVQDTYGPRSLHPSVITVLTKGDVSREGPIAFQALKEIILTEHTLGQHYYNIDAKDHMYLEHVLTEVTPYLKAQVEAINVCWKGRPKALQTLMDDIYTARDSIVTFVSIEGTVMSIVPSMETKVTSTFALAPLIQKTLGLLSTVTALVLVDEDYTYCGHIYAGPAKQYGGLNAIGIRTSMNNLICRTLSGVTEKLFKGMLMWGAIHGYNHIRVMGPFSHVRDGLLKLGFVFDQPDDPILYYSGPTKDIEMKEYGTYFADLLRPLINTPQFEQDIHKIVETLSDTTPAAAASHLQFRLLATPRDMITAITVEIEP